jgi:hypothetical protein
MITNFKIFENNHDFKEDDYVLLDVNALHNEDYETDGLAIIVYITNMSYFPYLVVLSDDRQLFIERDKVIRHLTEEEIEEYKIKSSSNKYNI